MKIELITPETHALLLDIYKDFPELSLQNKGYEDINRDLLSPEAIGKIKEIESILKESIDGFVSFQNFKVDRNNRPKIRFQYHYSSSFTGVGYILIDELLNGFED